jgi:hypothetical protein
MTIGELWNRILTKIDEFSVNGTLRTATDNIDYRLRGNRIIDEVQKDMAKIIKIAKTKEFTQYPISNQLGNSNFPIYQHIGTDISYESNGSMAYYFEVDGEATVYIEEETATDTWAMLTTISIPSTVTSFTAYKGKITASNTANNIRIRFGGSYPYQFRNIALYNINFKADANIPAFQLYVRYTMPSNFYKLEKISFTNYNNNDYNNNFSDYYFENPTTLLVHSDYKGLIKVHYWAMPTDIPSNDTDPTTYDTTELEILDSAQDIMVSGVAGRLLLTDANKQGTAVSLINFYESEKFNMAGVDKVREKKTVRNIWGSSK